MKFSSSKVLIVFATLLISACAMKREPLPLDPFASWSEIRPQRTLIRVNSDSDPVDLNMVLSSEENLRAALDRLFPEFAAIDNLRERIERIRNSYGDRRAAAASGDRQFSALDGLGGVMAIAILDAAEATLDRAGRFDTSKQVYEFVYGQIQDFTYDDGNGSGSFDTITYFTTVTVPVGVGPIVSETDAYRWIIKVGEGGFTVVKRDDAAPDGPFPGTMEFTQAMKDRVDDLGFQYKLWAEGTIIDIVEVWHKPDGAPDFTMLPTSDPKYARTADNCIDMLFVNYPPPSKGTLQPPLYCLGRCEDPEIINTGM